MMNWRPSSHEVAAAQELLSRRQARAGLVNFTNFTFPAYRPEAAHYAIGLALDRVIAGETDRLIVCAPPQHGKSELASVRTPALWLGRKPNEPVIVASYGAALATTKSRQARQVVESAEFARLFPGITTDRNSRAVNRWDLALPLRGNLLAVGVGGPITGHGARLGIIDDPIENWAQAQSKTIRNAVWEWWRTTFRTRIWEGGAIVLIMTRWHEDDLTGRLLQDQPGRWKVLRLPALAETQEERDANDARLGLPTGQPDPIGREAGEPLAPLRFSRAALLDIKRDVGELGWNAEYQGVPRAPEGNRVKRHMLEIVEQVPEEAQRVRYWDKAGTEDGGCRTVGVLLAQTGQRQWIVEDVVKGQWEALHREQVIKQTAMADAARYYNAVSIWLEQEPGSGGKESAENSIRMLAGYPVFADRVTGAKEIRWEPLIAQMQAGNVKLKMGAWNAEYIDEVCAIPNSTFKDQMDASAGAFAKLAAPGDEVTSGSLSGFGG